MNVMDVQQGTDTRIRELALFAGAGGGILGSHLLGWRTVCAVERDAYPSQVLAQRQNDGILEPFPIWSDVQTFDGTVWRGCIDVVSGGFPCQAFSNAAAGKNIASKNMWGSMRRIINEIRPSFVFGENVARKAINPACNDLEQMGYKTKALSLSAKDLGADHNRPRYWLLAYTDDTIKLLRGFHAKTCVLPELQNGFWSSDPGIARVPNGMAYRLDRNKATGNGQVPLVAASALIELVRLTRD